MASHLLILDTSIWIEYLKNNQNYFHEVRKLLESGEVLAVDCVFGELLQGAKNIYEVNIILDFWKHLPKEDYGNVIVKAGVYSSEKKLLDKGVGLIDAIILMHGIKSNSKIWTLDKKFYKIIPKEFRYVE